MQSAEATWNDERLDELAHGVRDLRAEMKAGHEALRAEMKAGDDSLRGDMSERFGEVNVRFDRLERAIYGFWGTMLAAFTTAFFAGAF